MLLVSYTVPDEDPQEHSSENDSVMVGRASGNDIPLEISGVSRYHARIIVEDGDVFVEDLGSTNGTWVNTERVERQQVSESDLIHVGDVVLSARFVVEEQDEEPEPVSATLDAAPAPLPPKPEAPVDSDDDEDGDAPPARASADDGDLNNNFFWKSLRSFLAPVWEFIEDESVSEIMINGAGEIYIERKGKLFETQIDFGEDQLYAAVLNIAQYVGRRVSEHEPYLDARLPDGSRVAVLMPPCSRKGISIAIRKFSKEGLTLDKLIGFGSMTPEMVTFLRAAVMLKKNIVISGGTSSGKTSLLNVLSSLIPNDERIITIEDSAELQLHQDHIVPMETKPPDKKGRGEVTIRDLVKVSLRMRPDRVVVGEIRGGEAIDLLQAMNTGHSGSMCTLHASSPRQALTRLETLSLFSGLDIPISALREQVSSAVELVIQASRLPDHSRKVTHISEICALDQDGNYIVKDIFRFQRDKVGTDGKIEGSHVLTGYVPSFYEAMELAALDDAVNLFSEYVNDNGNQ